MLGILFYFRCVEMYGYYFCYEQITVIMFFSDLDTKIRSKSRKPLSDNAYVICISSSIIRNLLKLLVASGKNVRSNCCKIDMPGCRWRDLYNESFGQVRHGQY